MKLTADQRLPPDLVLLFFDPRWCLNIDGADQIARSMHTFMGSLRLDEGNDSAASFDPYVEPPSKKQKTHIPDPDDTVANRHATSLLEAVRSNSPHRYGSSREKI